MNGRSIIRPCLIMLRGGMLAKFLQLLNISNNRHARWHNTYCNMQDLSRSVLLRPHADPLSSDLIGCLITQNVFEGKQLNPNGQPVSGKTNEIAALVKRSLTRQSSLCFCANGRPSLLHSSHAAVKCYKVPCEVRCHHKKDLSTEKTGSTAHPYLPTPLHLPYTRVSVYSNQANPQNMSLLRNSTV